MAGDENKNKGKDVTKVETAEISIVDFCDQYGVNPVDRDAVVMKHGKNTSKTEAEWVKLLTGEITIKENKS